MAHKVFQSYLIITLPLASASPTAKHLPGIAAYSFEVSLAIGLDVSYLFMPERDPGVAPRPCEPMSTPSARAPCCVSEMGTNSQNTVNKPVRTPGRCTGSMKNKVHPLLMTSIKRSPRFTPNLTPSSLTMPTHQHLRRKRANLELHVYGQLPARNHHHEHSQLLHVLLSYSVLSSHSISCW